MLARVRGAVSTNAAWAAVKRWLKIAATNAFGRLRFISGVTRRDFLTPQFQEKQLEHQQRVRTLQQLSIRHQNQPALRDALRLLATAAGRELDAAMRDRRTEVFREMADNLSDRQNTSALLRILSTTKARRGNTGCKLDPALMENHAEHFRGTFGLAPTGVVPDAGEFAPTDAYRVEPITEIELDSAWKFIPFGKAAGVDGLMGEMVAYSGPAGQEVFRELFDMVVSHGAIPDDWHTALVVPIFKNKGSDKEARNYRPIALTCVVRRLFERILCTRLEALVSHQLSDFQGGFRRHRSTLQQVFCLHEVMVNRPGIQVVLLDLRAAYDSVDRRLLWLTLRDKFGVPDSFITLIKALFEGNQSVLLVSPARSAPIPNLRGLLQGSTLSPLLFNLFLNGLLERLHAGPLVQTALVRLNTLAFAARRAALVLKSIPARVKGIPR